MIFFEFLVSHYKSNLHSKHEYELNKILMVGVVFHVIMELETNNCDGLATKKFAA